jgi:hypothetical protein
VAFDFVALPFGCQPPPDWAAAFEAALFAQKSVTNRRKQTFAVRRQGRVANIDRSLGDALSLWIRGPLFAAAGSARRASGPPWTNIWSGLSAERSGTLSEKFV